MQRGGAAGPKRPRSTGPAGSAASRGQRIGSSVGDARDPAGNHSAGGRGGSSGAGRGNRRLDEEIDLDGVDSDENDSGSDNGSAGGGSGADAAEFQESADQKRLRLAKEYLQKLARSTAGAGSGGRGGVDHLDATAANPDDDDDDDNLITTTEEAHNAIAAKLRDDTLIASGGLFRPVAGQLKQLLRSSATSAGDAGAAVDGAQVQHAPAGIEVIVRKGHELPATCIALSPDGRSAYTGSKDCSIVKWAISAAASGDAAHSAPTPSSTAAAASSSTGVAATSISVDKLGRYPGRRRTKDDVARQLQAAKNSRTGKGSVPVVGAAFGGGRLSTLTGSNASGGDGDDFEAKQKIVHNQGVSSITVTSTGPMSKKAAAIARIRGIPDYGIKGHWDEILCISVSSDGQYLATGGRDKAVRVWEGDVSSSASASASAAAYGVAAGAGAGPASAASTGVRCETFVGHKDAVTALAFRPGSHALYSGGSDRMVKLWSCDEMSHIETLFGHQADITDLDCAPSGKERCITSGRDRTSRLWRIPEQTQLVFRAHTSDVALECIRSIGDGHFVTGGQDGSLALWSVSRKRPIFTLHYAHGTGMHLPAAQTNAPAEVIAARARVFAAAAAKENPDTGEAPEHSVASTFAAAVASHVVGSLARDSEGFGPSDGALQLISAVTGCGVDALSSGYCNWICSMAVLPNSDLMATGSGDGFIRFWRLVPQAPAPGARQGERAMALRGIEHVGGVACKGVITGLAFSRDGSTLVASVGQEHRLGRWWRYKHAKNGIVVVKLPLSATS